VKLLPVIPRVIAAVVVGVTIPFSVAAQRHTIRLDPHEEAGQTYHLVANSTQSTMTEASVPGQLLSHNMSTLTAKLVADVVVVEAVRGWATSKRFKCLSSEVIRDGRSSIILPAGTEVVALVRNGETVYEVNGRPVGGETAAALSTVITLHLASVGDDDMFGTPIPQRAGASWTTNADNMKKLLAEMGSKGGRPEITGKGTLEKVENNYLFVRGSITVKAVPLQVRPGLTAENGEIQNELWGKYPIRPNDTSRESNGRIRISSFSSGVNAEGTKVMVHVVVEYFSRFEISPIQR